MSEIGDNIKCILTDIPSNVNLVAVSKTRSVEEIREAYDTGVRDFGENKVQELMTKVDELPSDIRWHLIGHLQRNKVKYIVGKVYMIHSLDSIELLNEIEKRYSAADLTANVLIEINIGREESKTGILEENLDRLINACEECKHVRIKGIMAIIPKGDDESCRNYFKKVKSIYDGLKNKNYSNVTMEVLSMGMSSDYKIAVSEGSNLIRVGQSIFGKRIYKNI